MRHLRNTVVLLLFSPAVLACDFQYSPVAVPQYYRTEGWKLLGITDFDTRESANSYGAPISKPIPGATAYLLPHAPPYIVEFPEQQFVLNGVRERMHATKVKATIIRWQVDKHVVAYSYGLIPVVAHRNHGKWIVDDEMACIFFATFIDDKGDGVFRLLVPTTLSADLIPLWAKPEKN